MYRTRGRLESMEPPFEFVQRIPPKLRWPLVILCLAVFDAVVEMALPSTAGGFLALVRAVLEAIPTNMLLAFAFGALVPYVWDERKRWVGALRGWFRKEMPPTPVARGDILNATATLGPRRPPLTAYELEQKLPVIDQALLIVGESMEHTIQDGPHFQTNAWNAFKGSGGSYATYGARLAQYRDTFQTNARTLDALRDKHQQHLDIVRETQQTYYEDCNKAIEGFLVTYGRLKHYLKDDAPYEVFEALMKPHRDAFGKAIQDFTMWRNRVRDQLIRIRTKLAP
jgi:hypothetical protein